MTAFALHRAAILVAATVSASCSDERPSATEAPAFNASPASSRSGRVILVTIDGARWQEVFNGSDPALGGPQLSADAIMFRTRALVASRGVALGATREGCGTVHTAGGSNVSLPGYIEIFTGHASRCLDNKCGPVTESVLDEVAQARNDGAASIGSWEVLAKAVSGGRSSVFVSAGRSWPADPTGSLLGELAIAGLTAGPYPGHDGYRADDATAAIALEYFRRTRPALFHVGFGDTDEYGHRGDYFAYLDALRKADAFIGSIADVLDATGLARETTVIVTPDHGRSADFRDHGALYPESGRTFVLAFGGGVPVVGAGCPAGDITLADLAPTIRVLTGLPPDTSEGSGTPIRLITGEK